jgi:cyanophycin synthetase
VAARYFDDIIIREDKNPRGRKRGEIAEVVREGVDDAIRKGARVGSVEIVLDEMEATKRASSGSRPGDLVVLCVDDAREVWRELEARRSASLGGPGASGDGHMMPGDFDEAAMVELDPGL